MEAHFFAWVDTPNAAIDLPSAGPTFRPPSRLFLLVLGPGRQVQSNGGHRRWWILGVGRKGAFGNRDCGIQGLREFLSRMDPQAEGQPRHRLLFPDLLGSIRPVPLGFCPLHGNRHIRSQAWGERSVQTVPHLGLWPAATRGSAHQQSTGIRQQIEDESPIGCREWGFLGIVLIRATPRGAFE